LKRLLNDTLRYIGKSLNMTEELTNKVLTFSIITPSYNQGEFLAETIESILRQAGNFFIDYVVVDGGSTDNSAEIIRHYDSLLQRGEWPIQCRGITFRWLSEKDKGQTDALMKGFRMATGDIFAWLNSDDTYLPGALQSAAGFFGKHPEVGLMYGDAYYCDRSGGTIGSYRAEEFDLDKLASANIICQPSAFFWHDVFNAVGGLDETLQFVMDYDLWIRIGRRFPCLYLPEFFSMYRLHETSKTILDKTLIMNSEESLSVTIRHFGWAPLTRVYTSCAIRCRSRLPGFLVWSRIALVATTIICSLFCSLRLNRGFHRSDLKLLNRDNFRKLFKSRIEIMTGKIKSRT
jgi:glycosyltransferase involved in cell wall biosynthesis